MSNQNDDAARKLFLLGILVGQGVESGGKLFETEGFAQCLDAYCAELGMGGGVRLDPLLERAPCPACGADAAPLKLGEGAERFTTDLEIEGCFQPSIFLALQ